MNQYDAKGRKHGLWVDEIPKTSAPNTAIIQSKGVFVNGRQQGAWFYYWIHYNENGVFYKKQMLSHINIKNGVINGIVTKWFGGEIKEQGLVRMGYDVGEWTINGKLYTKTTTFHIINSGEAIIITRDSVDRIILIEGISSKIYAKQTFKHIDDLSPDTYEDHLGNWYDKELLSGKCPYNIEDLYEKLTLQTSHESIRPARE